MVLAYVLMLSLCATQAMNASAPVLTAVDDDSQLPTALQQVRDDAPPSPSRASRSVTPPPVAPSSPRTPKPKVPAIKASPGKSPFTHKFTPDRSGVRVRTDQAAVTAHRLMQASLASTSVVGSSGSDSDGSSSTSSGSSSPRQSLFIDSATKDILKSECAKSLDNLEILASELETMLAATGTTFDQRNLYREESAFWANALVKIDPRIIAKMPYRRHLGVSLDRAILPSGAPSPSFNGKNKGNAIDHAFSYEFFYKILTSPETRAYKMLYEADLSDAKDGSMRVAYYVIELHYPITLTYVKSANSPVGGKPTLAEVHTDLGPRTAVIAFSQSPEALKDAFASTSTTVDMGSGDVIPFIENRFNWAFHAQHQKGVAPALIPVQVEVDILADASGNPCIELLIMKP